MSAVPSSARGAATRQRILDAAAEEFARYGIAGARIDRISLAARANKAQLYSYFGSKDELFDAVIADRVTSSTDAVPFDVDDLPGWTVALYDHNVRQPDLARLIAWTRLERRPTGPWFDDTSQYQPKIAAIEQAQAAGRVRAGDPFDLLTLLIATASAWSPASSVYTASADETSADHDRRRALLRDYVKHATAPIALGADDERGCSHRTATPSPAQRSSQAL